MNGCSNGRMRGSPCPEAWVCPVPEPVGLKVWANPHQSQPSCSRRAGWKRGRTAQNPPFFRRGSLQYGLLPDLTRVTTDWLFEPDVIARPDFDPSDTVAILDLVNRQDWEVCELAQQGVSSRAYAHGGNYAPDEHHIRGFVDYILDRLG